MHKAWRKPKSKIDVLGTPTQEFFSAFESIFSKIDCPCHIDNIFILSLFSFFVKKKYQIINVQEKL